MSVKSLYEIFNKVRPNLLFVAFALFVISWVMKYGAPGGYEDVLFLTDVSRYLAIFIIVIGQPISFRKNIVIIGLWMFYNLYEFILVVLGVHTNQVHQISAYLLDIGIYVFMAISLTTYLSKNVYLLWASVQVGLTVALGWMAILFHSELMTYIPDLVSGVFQNSRVARVGIGFYNVNILGGLSGLLIFVSLVNVFKNKFRYSSVITTVFGIYLLLNSGTRSAMLALVATFLAFVLLVVGRNSRRILNYLLPLAFFVAEFLYGLFMKTVNQNSGIADVVSSLTSKRSELGAIAFEQLNNFSKFLFGTGMRTQADIRGTFFSDWQGNYGLDGEPQWFIFTTGIIGGLVTLLIIAYAMNKAAKSSMSGFLFMAYFGTIMMFEHVFFNSQSVSGASGLLLTVIFIALIGNTNEVTSFGGQL
ncbi:hypothetical protein [Weissella confusa]|uniref:hypothetical protein n=1 Tax=Weissella confusa TaxID=1583 RepID=UPI0018F1882E|nr:hypothetical protein [Weissella confusa]MBJ7693513.1 hypothetical protein [Weissella confusa]